MILASGSPQRRATLGQLGVDFRVEPADVEELSEGDPRELVVENALRKARAVAARNADEAVLGADTAVILDEHVLGKPRDEAEAERFLRGLSGRAHDVVSGVALCVRDTERTDAERTRVTFRPLRQRELDWYLASGEWRDRAGGYAIQGKGAALVERIEGDYWTVVGLPVPALVRLVPDLLTAPLSR